MAIITLESDILYQMGDSAGLAAQQVFKQRKNFELVGDWTFKDKLNDIKTFEFGIENTKENRSNVILERNVNIPLITPFSGIITKKTPNNAILQFRAAELAWHFKRRKLKCHESPRVIYTDENWHDRLWKKRKKITVQSKKIDLDSGALADYVFTYQITSEELKFHALPNGHDIFFAFVNADNISVKMDHQIERYENGTGTLTAYIRLPKLESQNNTEFFMYYDNDDAADQSNSDRVWDSYHKAVLLLDNNFTDSSRNGHNGRARNVTFKDGSASFNGINSDINIGNGGGIDNIFDGGGHISFRINPISDGEANTGMIIGKTDGNAGWVVIVKTETDSFVKVAFEIARPARPGKWETSTVIPLNLWTKIDIVYNSNSNHNNPVFFINGIKNTVGNGITRTSLPSGFFIVGDRHIDSHIGNVQSQTNTFHGMMSSFKLKTIPTFDNNITIDDLIHIEYRNETQPLEFFVTDTQENFKEQADIIADQIIESSNVNMPILDDTKISNLVSLWRLNGNALDSKSINNGRWSGNEQYQKGLYTDDRGAKFDGAASIAMDGDDTPFDFERTDPFSIAFFYKSTTVRSDAFFTKLATFTDKGYGVRLTNFGIDMTFVIHNGTTSTAIMDASFNYNDGNWCHIAVTYDGSSNRSGMKIYRNGNLVKTGTTKAITGSILNNTNPNMGGNGAGFNLLTGGLDDVRVYSKELTSKEIKKLFLQTESGLDSSIKRMKWKLGEGIVTEIDGLVSLWKFDSNLKDSKTDNDVIVSGTEQYENGKYGKGFSFDGNTHLVIPPDDFNFQKTDPFAWSFIFKGNNLANNEALITKHNFTAGYRIYFDVSNNLNLIFDDGANEQSWTYTTNLRDGNLHHIIITYDGSNHNNGVKFYIDGNEVVISKNGTFPRLSIRNGENLRIGSNKVAPFNYVTGIMDDVRCYSKNITKQEVKALFEATSSGIDRVRDDDIPTDLIGLSFQHQTNLQALQSVALAVPTDLWFDNKSFTVRMEQKGKTVHEVVNIRITSKPTFDLEKVSNVINVLGKRTELGKQLETTVQDDTNLKYDYEETIIDTNIKTEDQLNQISGIVLNQVKILTPDLKATLPYDQFNKYDLQSGDIILINDKKNDISGFFRIISLIVKPNTVTLQLDQALNSRIRTKSTSVGDLINSLLRSVDETQIES